MDFTDYTIQKVTLVLEQIERLSQSDFPHPDANDALELLKKVFERNLDGIHKSLSSDIKLKESACAQANLHVARFLPILGIALRSTNVRNSFELFVPLLQICRRLLDNQTKLILSSEWNFSPFTYPLVFPELPNFVLIGLPASEAGNALIVPLAGHELGHSVWRKYGMDVRVTPGLQKHMIDSLRNRWAEFEAVHQTKQNINNIETDLFIRSIWALALDLARRQVQEIFCDSMGIRIFGESYFHATEYLICPHFGNRRSMHYPDIKTRMEAMVRTAAKFAFTCPDRFPARFTEAPLPLDAKQRFILSLSDEATRSAIDDLILAVDAIAAHVNLPVPTVANIDAIYRRFKEGIPGTGLSNVADVINAGWKAYFDEDLWKRGSKALERFGALNELIFKTIEVMEFEIRLGAP